ncbi:hypothetical protein GCM10022246_22940 [Pedobacter ginsengiterrae]|uniref:Uncharacterized protein n=1 Tax=Pedobacter ginsengiterrae TaxID=871696 RepID=A0ABP7PT73_9SPHI
MKSEFIYIPFNNSNENYIEEMANLSSNLFHVSTDVSSDKKSLQIESENQNLVSVMVNPVYAIITKVIESDLANEIYEMITANTKKFCN